MSEQQTVAVFTYCPSFYTALFAKNRIRLPTLDVVRAVDKCRGGVRWITLRAMEPPSGPSVTLTTASFIRLVRAFMRLPAIADAPSLGELCAATSNAPFLEIVLPTVVPTPVPALVRWTVGVPRALDIISFHPGAIVSRMTNFFASESLVSLERQCGDTRAQTGYPCEMFTMQSEVLSICAHAPLFPLLLAGLANTRVRDSLLRTLRLATPVLPSARFWSTLLYVFLRRAVEVAWSTDAEAASMLAADDRVVVIPLGCSRLDVLGASKTEASPPTSLNSSMSLHYDDSFDALSTSTDVARPCIGIDEPALPTHIRIGREEQWREIPFNTWGEEMLHHTGYPLQALVLMNDMRTFLCREDCIDQFIAHFATRVAVPIEPRRVCRRLVFVDAAADVPVGASRVVLLNTSKPPTQLVEWPGYVRNYATLRRLYADVVTVWPRILWPITSAQDILHPLRSACGYTPLVVATGLTTTSRFVCGYIGPSRELDGLPSRETLADILAFNAVHAPATAPPTALFAISPPCSASQPNAVCAAVVGCRMGCMACGSRDAACVRGTSALVTRGELHNVLWWWWHEFAERVLLGDERKADLGARWFVHEARAVHALIHAARRKYPSALHTAPKPRAGSVLLMLRDDNNWSISPEILSCPLREQAGLTALEANVVVLLFHINDTSACGRNSWIEVGFRLYAIDPDNATLERAWRWWSRRYGGDSYDNDKWDGPRREWTRLHSRKERTLSAVGALKWLTSRANQMAGHDVCKSDQVPRVLQTFIEETSEW